MDACTLSGSQSAPLRGLFAKTLECTACDYTTHVESWEVKTIPRYHPDAKAFKGDSLLSLPVMADYLFIRIFYDFSEHYSFHGPSYGGVRVYYSSTVPSSFKVVELYPFHRITVL